MIRLRRFSWERSGEDLSLADLEKVWEQLCAEELCSVVFHDAQIQSLRDFIFFATNPDTWFYLVQEDDKNIAFVFFNDFSSSYNTAHIHFCVFSQAKEHALANQNGTAMSKEEDSHHALANQNGTAMSKEEDSHHALANQNGTAMSKEEDSHHALANQNGMAMGKEEGVHEDVQEGVHKEVRTDVLFFAAQRLFHLLWQKSPLEYLIATLPKSYRGARSFAKNLGFMELDILPRALCIVRNREEYLVDACVYKLSLQSFFSEKGLTTMQSEED